MSAGLLQASLWPLREPSSVAQGLRQPALHRHPCKQSMRGRGHLLLWNPFPQRLHFQCPLQLPPRCPHLEGERRPAQPRSPRGQEAGAAASALAHRCPNHYCLSSRSGRLCYRARQHYRSAFSSSSWSGWEGWSQVRVGEPRRFAPASQGPGGKACSTHPEVSCGPGLPGPPHLLHAIAKAEAKAGATWEGAPATHALEHAVLRDDVLGEEGGQPGGTRHALAPGPHGVFPHAPIA